MQDCAVLFCFAWCLAVRFHQPKSLDAHFAFLLDAAAFRCPLPAQVPFAVATFPAPRPLFGQDSQRLFLHTAAPSCPPAWCPSCPLFAPRHLPPGAPLLLTRLSFPGSWPWSTRTLSQPLPSDVCFTVAPLVATLLFPGFPQCPPGAPDSLLAGNFQSSVSCLQLERREEFYGVSIVLRVYLWSVGRCLGDSYAGGR